MAAFVDAEHALDPAYAKKLGVDIDNLLVSQPDYGEQALEITEALVRSGAIDVLVVDSVAALVPKAELDGEMGDTHMGLQARLMSQALRKLTGTVSKSRTCLIFINQIREKIGVMFGNPETTTGGRALKFYSSGAHRYPPHCAIKEGDGGWFAHQGKDREEQSGGAVPRSRIRHSLRRRAFRAKAICSISRCMHNIVEKSGAWYSYRGERIGQGRENARKFLKENKDTMVKWKRKSRKKLGIGQADPTAAAVPAPAQSAPQVARVTTMPTGNRRRFRLVVQHYSSF